MIENQFQNKFENYSYDGVTRILIFKLGFEKKALK